jgi:hypothetical protein
MNNLSLERFCDLLNKALGEAEAAGTISKSGVFCYTDDYIKGIVVDCADAYDV